jgi:hypothetical protein
MAQIQWVMRVASFCRLINRPGFWGFGVVMASLFSLGHKTLSGNE